MLLFFTLLLVTFVCLFVWGFFLFFLFFCFLFVCLFVWGLLLFFFVCFILFWGGVCFVLFCLFVNKLVPTNIAGIKSLELSICKVTFVIALPLDPQGLRVFSSACPSLLPCFGFFLDFCVFSWLDDLLVGWSWFFCLFVCFLLVFFLFVFVVVVVVGWLAGWLVSRLIG